MKKIIFLLAASIAIATGLQCNGEDCVSFNPETAKVELIDNDYKIVDGDHWVFSFGKLKSEAEQALKIIKFYKMNNSCFVGRPDPSFKYLLIHKTSPMGAYSGEDCVSFNLDQLMVKEYSPTDYRIVDETTIMYAFGDKKSEADEALSLIKKHEFTMGCYVGRPDASFEYLRK